MTYVLSVLNIAAPLLLVTLGALISEYSGRMALFLDGAINLSAFFCYLFTYFTGSLIAGSLLSVLCTTLLVYLLEKAASALKANMFLVSLAMNIFFSALATLISVIAFNTRGVLYSERFKFNPSTMRIVTSCICYGLSLITVLMLKFTSTGLCLRITGSDSEVLEAEGISSSHYRSLSWILAGIAASVAGCTLACRLSSYVPGMASGRGWTALAAVFLGRKSPVIVAVSVLVFAAAEFLSTWIQNISIFQNIPSSFLLSLPYLIALLLIVVIPQKKENQNR